MKRLTFWAFALSCTLVMLACSNLPSKVDSFSARADLLDGRAIFGEPVLVSESLPLDPLHASEEMREFVGEIVSAKPEIARYRMLVSKLEDYG